MRDSVIVNGVTLTREQVETAVKELNRPEPLQVGDVIRFRGILYLIVAAPDPLRVVDGKFQVSLASGIAYQPVCVGNDEVKVGTSKDLILRSR